MGEHARLSPSGSKRWMACPGSITLEAAFPNTSSTYADDGTACHSVAADCLTSDSLVPVDWLGDKVRVNIDNESDRHVLFTPELVEVTAGYVNAIRALAKGHELHVEQRVEFSEFVGVLDQFGTADAIVLRADGEMGVYDLKTGFKFVPVENNSQLMLYALGAYRQFELTHDIKSIRLGIYQPQHGGLREWVCSVEDLLAFAAKAKAAAQRVEKAALSYGNFGWSDEAWEAEFLHPNPNEIDCAFCRAMATCPAARRQVEKTIGAGFDVVVEEAAPITPMGLLEDDLALAMRAAPFLEDFTKAVRAEVERRLMQGIAVEGFGLELGKQGNRKWKDEEEAENLLRKVFRLKIEDAYDMKLISPTTAEKLATALKPTKKNPNPPKPKLTPLKWKKMQPLIMRAASVPSVKPLAQIKEPWRPPSASAEMFNVVNEEPEQLW